MFLEVLYVNGIEKSMETAYTATVWEDGELIPPWEEGGEGKFYLICLMREADLGRPTDERMLWGYLGWLTHLSLTAKGQLIPRFAIHQDRQAP